MNEAEAVRPPERIRRPVWWLGLGVITLTAGALSLDAYVEGFPSLFDRIPHLDKVFHFGLGGTLAFFLDGALRRRMIHVGGVALPAAAVLLLVPAGIEEYLQRYSLYRTSSFSDFAADVLGVTFFIWLSRRVG